MAELKQRLYAWIDRFSEKHGVNLRWFIRYFIGGVITVAVEFFLFFLFSYWETPWRAIVSLLPDNLRTAAENELHLWAIVMSNIVSYVVNYLISKYWVFHSPETKHRRDALLYLMASIVNLIVVLFSAKFILIWLELLPIGGSVWEALVPIIGKVGSNAAAFITVLLFKRFIIWNDTSKY